MISTEHYDQLPLLDTFSVIEESSRLFDGDSTFPVRRVGLILDPTLANSLRLYENWYESQYIMSAELPNLPYLVATTT